MRKQTTSFMLAGLLASLSMPALAVPKVTASIAPIHSLVASIMQNVGEPSLLFPSNTSPHDAQMRPSQARQLQDANLVFWIGPEIETAVAKALKNLDGKAHSVPLLRIEGVKRLTVREDANWERHNHDHGEEHHEHEHEHEHEHDDHDNKEHGHGEKHDDHDHKEHAHDEHDHKKHDHGKKHDDHDHKRHDHEKHDHDERSHNHSESEKTTDEKHWDNHIWLAPENAIAMAMVIRHELIEIDPENAQVYKTNSDKLIASIKQQIAKIDKQLNTVRHKPFMVFHDAYQYYEQHFGLNAVGSIRLHPEVAPGAARIKQIREKLVASEVACLMSEPQFSDSILLPLVEGTKTRLGSLDPIGNSLEVGPTLYQNLLQLNADNLEKCLTSDK